MSLGLYAPVTFETAILNTKLLRLKNSLFVNSSCRLLSIFAFYKLTAWLKRTEKAKNCGM
jgi:hypothetical protein